MKIVFVIGIALSLLVSSAFAEGNSEGELNTNNEGKVMDDATQVKV